jgi:hypothetical protein
MGKKIASLIHIFLVIVIACFAWLAIDITRSLAN